MKNTRTALLLLLAVVPAIAQTSTMTNSTIQSMVHAGAPLETIVRAIKTAPRIDLYINDREYAQFLAAGASSADTELIMKAIHDREYNGAEKIPGPPVANAIAPAPVAAAPDPPPSSAPLQAYLRIRSARSKFKTSVDAYSIWIDDTRWKLQPSSSPGTLEFRNVDGESGAKVITERIGMPTGLIIQGALKGVRNIDPAAMILSQDRRIVNGRPVTAVQMSGSALGIKARYFGYFHGGTAGTIQVMVYTAESALNRNSQQLTEFLNGLEISDQELPPAPVSTELSNSGSLVFDDGHMSVRYDPAKWRTMPSGSSGRFNLLHAKGDGYATVIVERIPVSLDALPDIALLNARKLDPDAAITFREKRNVNGVDVWFLKMEATAKGAPLTYYGYYYSCDAGTVQVLAFTGRRLIAEYDPDFLQLLNGLHVN